jgi:hypothetical protein
LSPPPIGADPAAHAIRISPGTSGSPAGWRRAWFWELIDAAGATSARGMADTQDEAMRSAWAEGLTLEASAARAFPQIELAWPATAAGGRRAAA